jgi:hypothetical protein
LEDEEGLASSLANLGFVAVLGEHKAEASRPPQIGDLLVLERLIAASQGDHIFRVCAER